MMTSEYRDAMDVAVYETSLVNPSRQNRKLANLNKWPDYAYICLKITTGFLPFHGHQFAIAVFRFDYAIEGRPLLPAYAGSAWRVRLVML